jgi:hypothetical protein
MAVLEKSTLVSRMPNSRSSFSKEKAIVLFVLNVPIVAEQFKANLIKIWAIKMGNVPLGISIHKTGNESEWLGIRNRPKIVQLLSFILG